MSNALMEIFAFLENSRQGDARSLVSETAHVEYISLCAGIAANPTGFYKSLEDYIGGSIFDKLSHGSSFQHENGFTKLSLRKFSDGRQLRLHIYPEGEYVDSRIHNHRWNLSSCILEGTLEGINYAEADRDREVTVNLHQLFDAKDAKKESVFKNTTGLKVAERYVCGPEQGHYLQADIFHKVKKPTGARTVTLMLTGMPLTDYSTIVEEREFQPAQRDYYGVEGMKTAIRSLYA